MDIMIEGKTYRAPNKAQCELQNYMSIGSMTNCSERFTEYCDPEHCPHYREGRWRSIACPPRDKQLVLVTVVETVTGFRDVRMALYDNDEGFIVDYADEMDGFTVSAWMPRPPVAHHLKGEKA